MVFAARTFANPPCCFIKCVKRIMCQITLSTTGKLAGQANSFEFFKQILPTAVNRKETVRGFAIDALSGHHIFIVIDKSKIIGDTRGVHTRRKTGLIGYGLHQITAQIDFWR